MPTCKVTEGHPRSFLTLPLDKPAPIKDTLRADAVCIILTDANGTVSVPANVKTLPDGCLDPTKVAPGGDVIHVTFANKCINTGDSITVTARAAKLPTSVRAQWLNNGNIVWAGAPNGTIVEKNDGSLAGVTDIVVGSVNSGAGLFYCIVKTEHETVDNAITTWLQCNIDIEGAGVAPTTNTPPTWDDTCDELAARVPPSACLASSTTHRRRARTPSPARRRLRRTRAWRRARARASTTQAA